MPSIAERAHAEVEEPLLRERRRAEAGERQPQELAPRACLASLDFWLLFSINGICSGAGLTLLNNLGQQARTPHPGPARSLIRPAGRRSSGPQPRKLS